MPQDVPVQHSKVCASGTIASPIVRAGHQPDRPGSTVYGNRVMADRTTSMAFFAMGPALGAIRRRLHGLFLVGFASTMPVVGISVAPQAVAVPAPEVEYTYDVV